MHGQTLNSRHTSGTLTMAESSKALSKAQLRWVEEYLVDSNGKAAAIRAGFSSRGADALAKKYLANPAVLACVSNMQKALLASVEPSRDDVTQGLLQAFELARQQSDSKAMLAASHELGQLHGLNSLEMNLLAVDSQEGLVNKYLPKSDAELVSLMEMQQNGLK
jgi:phage terminase small subunit